MENIDASDLELTGAHLAAIDGRDTGRRGGPVPSDITLKNYGMPIPDY